MTVSNQALIEMEAMKKRNGRALFEDRKLMEALAAQLLEEQKTPWTIESAGLSRENLRVTDYPLPSGTQCYEFNPLNGEATGDTVIIYYHGGGWILQADQMRLDFCQRLADDNQCTVIFPIWPLGPTNTYKESLANAMEVYRKVFDDWAGKNIFLMGDSAGGYMTLVSAQLALQEGLPQPTGLFPLCPALDLSGALIEGKKKLDPVDLLLTWNSIMWFGDFWVPEGEPRDVFPVSVLDGPMEGLAPIRMLSGECEILRTDASALYNKAEAAGVDVEWSLYEGMWHCWFTYQGLPEAEEAIAEINEAIAAFCA